MTGFASIASTNMVLDNELAAASVELLDASRRVDWHFLLPTVQLEQVAYVGPQTDLICSALRSFSQSLTVFHELPRADEENRQFDVVVVIDPCDETLGRSAQIVCPGGAMYVEVNRRAAKPRYSNTASKLTGSADYVDALQRLGFKDVRAHWHCPDFDACTVIMPLTGHAAHLSFLQLRAASPNAKVKALFARWLLRCGLLNPVIRCFSVVAEKDAE